MSKRTPDQGVIPFEHRAGTQEVPTIGGMSRLGDEAQIPLRQHHLLVNVRFGPGEMGSRPGLVEEEDLGVAACITGLIETTENTGTGGGVVSGLLSQYWYGWGPTAGAPHFFYLNPQDDSVAAAESEARALIKQPASLGAGAHVWESWWPMGGVQSHWWGAAGCGPSTPIPGTLAPFDFQGATCVLGGYPELGLYQIVAPDDGGAGAVNRSTIFGSYVPVSQCIRKEIIGGEILDVLYFSATDGNIYRFDGTTLSIWYVVGGGFGGVAYYWRLYCSGQELLCLGDHPVSDMWVTGTPEPPGTADFHKGVIQYQPAPGELISPCTWVAPHSVFDADPFTGDTANRLIGWTGAARYRDKWYISLSSGPGAMHASVGGSAVHAYGQILQATVGGASLAFTIALEGTADYDDYNALSYNFGTLCVHKDKLYFVSSWKYDPIANGSCFQNSPAGAPMFMGVFDGIAWTPDFMFIGAAGGDPYYTITQVGWLISNGDQLVMGLSTFGQESVVYWREPDNASGLWPYNGDAFDVSNVTLPVAPAGYPLGAKSAYFAIPDEDAV